MTNQNNAGKTHYRKAFNSPYLSSADIVGQTILTISHVTLSGDETKKTKDIFNTAHFVEREIRQGEKLKPMILNAHNSKILRDLTGSHFLEDWKNIPVTIYVDSNVRFGRDTVEGLRISPQPPVLTKPELTPVNTQRWNSAVEACKRDGKIDAVLERCSMSGENKLLLKQAAGITNG